MRNDALQHRYRVLRLEELNPESLERPGGRHSGVRGRRRSPRLTGQRRHAQESRKRRSDFQE